MPAAALAPGSGNGGLKPRPPPPGFNALPTLTVTPPKLLDLNKLSCKLVLEGSGASDIAKAELARLCQEAATKAQACGRQLPVQDFAYLGSSIWQSAIVLAGQGSKEHYKACVAASQPWSKPL